MKKIILLLTFVFVCYNQLAAQKIITDPGTPVPVRMTYDITVNREDYYAHDVMGHAHTPVNLEIKIGSNPQFNSFAPDEPSPTLSKIYTFPVIYTLPGTPPPTRYVKVSTTYPSLVSSGGYFPLTTTVGDYTTITSDNLTYNNLGFGYGISIYCIAPNKYTMRVTRFECYRIPCDGGILTKNSNTQNDAPALVPNPSMGFSELYYTAADKETVSINVVDINGKIVRTYTTEVGAGPNKLPINIQNYQNGIYTVQWKSSTGANGTLRMVKN